MVDVFVGLLLLFGPTPVDRQHPAAPSSYVLRADDGVRGADPQKKSVFWRGKKPLICAADECDRTPPTFCLVGKGLRVEAVLPKRSGCDQQADIRDARAEAHRR